MIRQEPARISHGSVYSGEMDGKLVFIVRIHLLLLQARNIGEKQMVSGEIFIECVLAMFGHHPFPQLACSGCKSCRVSDSMD